VEGIEKDPGRSIEADAVLSAVIAILQRISGESHL